MQMVVVIAMMMEVLMGMVLFESWCVDGKSGDGSDDGDEQTESVAGDHVECDRSSKMEMAVGVMR